MNRNQESIALVSMLVKVADIHGKIDEFEEGLIRTMAEHRGLTDQVTDDIIAGRLSAEVEAPASEWERIPYFQMCVMMTGVNGEFHEKEEQFCTRIGLKMGLRPEVLEGVIALFKKYFPKAVPIEELKKTYQIGHN